MGMRLRLEARTFRDGLRRSDSRVRLCVGLRLDEKSLVREWGNKCGERWTYGAGFGLDACNGEYAFLLLDLIAVLAIDVL